MVQLLVDAGADVDAVDEFSDGTPLDRALHYGMPPDFIEFLEALGFRREADL